MKSRSVIAIGVGVVNHYVHFIVFRLLEALIDFISSFIHFIILNYSFVMVVWQWTLTSSSALLDLLILQWVHLVILVFSNIKVIVIFVVINVNTWLAFCVCVINFFYDVQTKLSLFLNSWFLSQLLCWAQWNTSTSVVDRLVRFCVQDVLDFWKHSWF